MQSNVDPNPVSPMKICDNSCDEKCYFEDSNDGMLTTMHFFFSPIKSISCPGPDPHQLYCRNEFNPKTDHKTTPNPTTCLAKVTFTVTNNHKRDEIIFKRLKRAGGCGPDEIHFGPLDAEKSTNLVSAEICPGTTYVLESYGSDGKDGDGKIRYNTREDRLEYNDDNSDSYCGLIVTPNKGHFMTASRYVLDSSISCDSSDHGGYGGHNGGGGYGGP